ncbi:OLC1v1038995C1 [Oldenlandia corymbosa var. corymbosa]|uniref:OLC1v1038995C1 n=1 Tax=Oldenlandia corymbosa var. corymbosa TaxID=529605 RepID=A0AAV1D468_OLDCO|nr:OLC1v1038995C1 [Oldenlandia corymbosa var. corymbosa]
MAELLRSNPERIEKAREELNQVIGSEEGVIQESDISRLPYLRAILNETLRLHPPAPLLVPHKANEDVEINGYIVPKETQILVNAYNIGRDETIWPEPEMFKPERFLESEIDVKGMHFELIPFGSGRRMCPGFPLAYRMVHIMLATLIYNIDWKLEGGSNRKIWTWKKSSGCSTKGNAFKSYPSEIVNSSLMPQKAVFLSFFGFLFGKDSINFSYSSDQVFTGQVCL